MSNKHIRLSSEQYVIDENNCITIPYDVIYNAGLGSDTAFFIFEKNDADNVYCIIPQNVMDGMIDSHWTMVQQVTCSKEEGMKIDVTGMFELKPGDSVSVDVYEFKLFMFDRVSVLKTKREYEEDEETGLDAGKIDWTKGFDEVDKYMKSSDPYAPDENTIEMMRDNLNKKFKKIEQRKDYNDLINNPPSIEELDQMFGNLLKNILSKSQKHLHRSKDPLLNEFIDDMLARVYGGNGKKVIMISSDELDQFVKDMTWWYNRIKKGDKNGQDKHWE